MSFIEVKQSEDIKKTLKQTQKMNKNMRQFTMQVDKRNLNLLKNTFKTKVEEEDEE